MANANFFRHFLGSFSIEHIDEIIPYIFRFRRFYDDPFNVGYLKFRGIVNAAMVVAQWPPVTI